MSSAELNKKKNTDNGNGSTECIDSDFNDTCNSAYERNRQITGNSKGY